ncbi:MAG: hypothetical protein AMXMBFR64_27350 [Myxococcales bacterium]
MKLCPTCMSECRDDAAECLACHADLSGVLPLRKDDRTGQTIAGKFKLLSRIGVGAMGSIWRAEQLSLGKIIAVKLLHRHLLADPTLSKRFNREARASARVSHPNAITIFDFGQTEDGLLYIAMELVDGQDLAQVLHECGPLGAERIVHIMKQVCGALDEAHTKGIIHRDLKPENIMVTQTLREKDFVKVLDFGIAKLQDRADSKDSFQTMAGIVCGTPEYMSPEQARGEELDARSDLYAMGVILYQLATGKLPFVGDSPIAVVTRHLTEQPRPPRELSPDIPKVFEGLILRLMHKRRDQRPPNALALLKELEAVEMALSMTGDTVQHPGSYTAPPEEEPPPEDGDKTSVVQRLPSELIREMQAAAKRESDDKAAAAEGASSQEKAGRKTSSPLPRPPVAARRVARVGSAGPRRYTPTHIESPSHVSMKAAGAAQTAASAEGGRADRTLVAPGLGDQVLKEARREAQARSDAPLGQGAAQAAPETLDMMDMHSQRTLALSPEQVRAARGAIQDAQRPPAPQSQAWVIYVLALAAVLGVGGFLLVRYVL